MPFWFGQYKFGQKNLADEVLARVKAVTVMSYRDTGTGNNSMLSVSRDWLARGAAAGKRIRLSAETGELPDCTYCTFAEEGAKRLNQELAKVDAATRQTAAFGGIAIHRYSAWRALPARGTRGLRFRPGSSGKGIAGPAGQTDERNRPAGPAFPHPVRRTGQDASRPQPRRPRRAATERTRVVELPVQPHGHGRTLGRRELRGRCDERTRRRGRGARPGGSGCTGEGAPGRRATRRSWLRKRRRYALRHHPHRRASPGQQAFHGDGRTSLVRDRGATGEDVVVGGHHLGQDAAIQLERRTHAGLRGRAQ